MNLHWYNVTCNATRHIVPAQRVLFHRYTPYSPIYIDLKDNPIDNWGKKVAEMLPDDEYIIFGLDDFLPIDKLDMVRFEEAHQIMIDKDLERFELGWGAAKKSRFIDCGTHLEYGETTPYKVSCQFSIWKTSALKRELLKITTPWRFEINGRCKAGCFIHACFRWIEESALSGRQRGKVNLCGLKLEDEKDLLNLELIKKSDVIYGWRGNHERTLEAYGTKYKEYY